MLSTHREDILRFIRDFETSSRDYLQTKGLSENEMTNAYLDIQWNFLHTILTQKDQQKNYKNAHNLYSQQNAM